MFARIQSTGIGPHADLDLPLSPTGRTIIRGRSEHGKSVLIDALLLALFGVVRGGEPFDADQMSADRLAVTLTTGTGRRFEVTRTRKGSPRWAHTLGEDVLPQTTLAGWIGALSALKLPLWTGGQVRRDAIALCLEPMAWTRYAVSSPTESRKLRDLLVSTAGATADEAAKELYLAAGFTWTAEPFAEKAAAAAVTEANRAHATATGAAGQARSSLASIEAQAPVEPDTSAADGLAELEAVERLWVAHDEAVRAYQRDGEAQRREAERHARSVNAWRARMSELDAHDLRAAERANEAHRAALLAWEEERDSRDQRHANEVARAAADFEAAVQARNARQAEREAAWAQRNEAEQARVAGLNRRASEEWAARCLALTADHDRLELAHENALQQQADDEAALATWEAQALLAATCESCGQLLPTVTQRPEVRRAGPAPAALALPPAPVPVVAQVWAPVTIEPNPVARVVPPLGPMRPAPTYTAPAPSPRPPEPLWTAPDPLVEPTAPTAPRPAPDALQAAREAMRLRTLHGARVEQWGRQVEAARSAVGRAEAEEARAKAGAGKAAAWLAAVRAAPGEVARRLSWLREIGDGITVELPTEGPAVVICIDGRPWRLASRGRLVCADAHFRRAFSVALKVPNLPIIVDERAAWTGAIEVSGPVIELVTDPTAERMISTVSAS